jgi:WD40 repeat protein
MPSQVKSLVTLLAFLLASACSTPPAPTRAVVVPTEPPVPPSSSAPTAGVANPGPSSSPSLSTLTPTGPTAIPTPVATRSRNQLTLLQYAPNGSLVVVTQAALLLVDPTSLAVIWSAPVAGDCCASVAVADNALAGIGDGASAAYLWDIASGQMVHRLEDASAQFSTLALSPDGSLLATGGNSRIQVWDALTGQAGASWTTGDDGFSAFPWTSRVTNLAFAQDASTLFSANWWTGQVTQWDLSSGTLAASFAFTNTIRYRFTPDASQLLVEFNDYGFEMHNPRTGALNARHPQIIGAPGSHTFSADAQRVAVWGYNTSAGPVAGVWDLGTGQLLQEVPCRGYSSPCWSQVVLSPDGGTLALSDESRDEIAFFDVATGAAKGEFLVP